MNSEIQIWDRQQGETARAFRSFTIYRDMPYDPDGNGTRSLQKVADKQGKTIRNMESLSSKYNWVERTLAYDDFISRQVINDQISQYRERIERHFTTAGVMRNAAGHIFQRLSENNFEGISPAEARRLLKDSAEIEQKSIFLLMKLFPQELTNQGGEEAIEVEEKAVVVLPAKESD